MFKSTVVNQRCPSLNDMSLEITLTVILRHFFKEFKVADVNGGILGIQVKYS